MCKSCKKRGPRGKNGINGQNGANGSLANIEIDSNGNVHLENNASLYTTGSGTLYSDFISNSNDPNSLDLNINSVHSIVLNDSMSVDPDGNVVLQNGTSYRLSSGGFATEYGINSISFIGNAFIQTNALHLETVSGVQVDGGIEFTNSTTSYVPSNLNYYEQVELSLNGSGAYSGSSKTFRISRIGNNVTIQFPTITFTSVANSTVIFGTIPNRFTNSFGNTIYSYILNNITSSTESISSLSYISGNITFSLGLNSPNFVSGINYTIYGGTINFN